MHIIEGLKLGFYGITLWKLNTLFFFDIRHRLKSKKHYVKIQLSMNMTLFMMRWKRRRKLLT